MSRGIHYSLASLHLALLYKILGDFRATTYRPWSLVVEWLGGVFPLGSWVVSSKDPLLSHLYGLQCNTIKGLVVPRLSNFLVQTSSIHPPYCFKGKPALKEIINEVQFLWRTSATWLHVGLVFLFVGIDAHNGRDLLSGSLFVIVRFQPTYLGSIYLLARGELTLVELKFFHASACVATLSQLC